MQDVRWRAALATGKDANGKPKRRMFTASTPDEGCGAIDEALRDRQRSLNIDPKAEHGQFP
jgi:hypothetical protein